MNSLRSATWLISLFVLGMVDVAAAQEAPPVVPLWEGGAPGSEDRKDEPEEVRVTDDGERVVRNVHHPSITAYLPDASSTSGAAVVIAPGGGHRELWSDHEGHNVAKYLRDHRVAGFVLKYRLAGGRDSPYDVDQHSVADMRRAIRLVRSRADQWHVNPEHVGAMGFSAGGEVAALASLGFDDGDADAVDPVERQSSEPAFQALIYPGRSNRYGPTEDSPPAFIVCGYGDRPDISRGMANMYLKFKDVGVPAELHIYSNAGHGFGMRSRNASAVGQWPARFVQWLQDRDMVPRD